MITVVDVRLDGRFGVRWVLCRVDSFEQRRFLDWVFHWSWGLDLECSIFCDGATTKEEVRV